MAVLQVAFLLCVYSGSYEHQQALQPSSGSSQRGMWCSPSISSYTPTHPQGSNRPAPGPAPALRHYAPMAHPYKPRGSVYVVYAQCQFQLADAHGIDLQRSRIKKQITDLCCVTTELLMFIFRSNMEQRSTPVKQKETVSMVRTGRNVPTNPAGFPPRVQQSMFRPQNPGHNPQFRLGPLSIPSPTRTSVPGAHTQDSSWMITSSFGTQRPALKEITGTNQPCAKQQTKVEVENLVENMSRSFSEMVPNFQCIQCVSCRK